MFDKTLKNIRGIESSKTIATYESNETEDTSLEATYEMLKTLFQEVDQIICSYATTDLKSIGCNFSVDCDEKPIKLIVCGIMPKSSDKLNNDNLRFIQDVNIPKFSEIFDKFLKLADKDFILNNVGIEINNMEEIIKVEFQRSFHTQQPEFPRPAIEAAKLMGNALLKIDPSAQIDTHGVKTTDGYIISCSSIFKI